MPSATPRTRKRRRISRTPYTGTKRRLNYSSPVAMPRLSLYNSAILRPRQRVKMIFGDAYLLTPAAANTLVKKQIRANSVYDPDYAVGGTSARGFDQLSALYERYVVLNAKIKVTFIPSPDNVADVFCSISPRDSAGTSTNIKDELEYGSCKYTILSRSRVTSDDPSNPQSVKTLTHGVNLQKFTGRTDPTDDNNTALMNGNPSNTVLFDVCVAPFTTNTSSYVRVVIQVYYDVLLMEPRNPASS